MIEGRHRQFRPRPAGASGQEGQELREIAVVGADGVRRGVLVEPQVLQKVDQGGFHRPGPRGLGHGLAGVDPALEIGERALG